MGVKTAHSEGKNISDQPSAYPGSISAQAVTSTLKQRQHNRCVIRGLHLHSRSLVNFAGL